jgi:hypothetical protein
VRMSRTAVSHVAYAEALVACAHITTGCLHANARAFGKREEQPFLLDKAVLCLLFCSSLFRSVRCFFGT